jgi:Omp85 superfamily domain
VNSSRRRANVAFVLVCALGLALPASAQQTPPTPASPPSKSSPPVTNELDLFMEKVLKRRDVNRQTLEQYVLDESEQFEVLGPARMPVYRQTREYTWYVRDGLHVRSPVRFDGVSVGDAARKEYEDNWARRERRRLERKDEKSKAAAPDTPEPDPAVTADDPAGPSGASPVPTPRFVSEAYFMDFKFEPGNYYLAGREQLEGHQVLRIEYYPKRMFNDNEDRDRDRGGDSRDRDRQSERNRERKRERELEQRIERQMNKTALVTLWVDPLEHQIVKYTFDNVWMDFLPAGWLVKVDDIRASMTMGQPFPGVWLPREMNIHAGVTMAMGSLEAAYERRFSDYKQADVKSLIRIPKAPAPPPSTPPPASHDESADGPSGPFVPEHDPQAEVIAEIRVHGNAYLRDEEVLRLAGVALGQPLPPDGLRAIELRLKASGHFESVEIRKRYRSLESSTDIALILLVHERPGFTSETVDERPSAWGWARMKSRLMFLPILDYDDGYGFTYGGRVSTIDLLGAGERLSVPLTWGGTRRAAVEFERAFKSGPLTRIESTFGIRQSENPRFEIDDQRVEWTARAERSFAGLVRAGIDTSQSTVEFGQLDDRLWTLGANVALDTRGDPAFPRNAVFLGAGWNGLHVRRLADPINRYTAEARGYVGVVRQAVLAARVQYASADRTLPDYERLLLGGASTLRGFNTGAFDGDRMFVSSAELRVPITSVLSGAKLGLTAFMDAGKAFNVGQSMKDAPWHQGAGGGVFLIATIVRLNLDVARGFRDGDTRVHFSSGFSF